jgi:hypothetical protein
MDAGGAWVVRNQAAIAIATAANVNLRNLFIK